jgi:phage-related protein
MAEFVRGVQLASLAARLIFAQRRRYDLIICTDNGTFTMALNRKRLPARFYRSDNGREPVREWLKSLNAEDRRIIGEDIKDVEFSWPIGMPLVRPLGRELWEVRSRLLHGRIARVLFFVEPDCMVLLHGFMKKTQKTPAKEIDLAIRRKKGTVT